MLTRQVGIDENPISHIEIRAYCENTGTQLEPWEVRAIVSLFWVHREARSKAKSVKAGAAQTASLRDMTAGLGKKRRVVKKAK